MNDIIDMVKNMAKIVRHLSLKSILLSRTLVNIYIKKNMNEIKNVWRFLVSDYLFKYINEFVIIETPKELYNAYMKYYIKYWLIYLFENVNVLNRGKFISFEDFLLGLPEKKRKYFKGILQKGKTIDNLLKKLSEKYDKIEINDLKKSIRALNLDTTPNSYGALQYQWDKVYKGEHYSPSFVDLKTGEDAIAIQYDIFKGTPDNAFARALYMIEDGAYDWLPQEIIKKYSLYTSKNIPDDPLLDIRGDFWSAYKRGNLKRWLYANGYFIRKNSIFWFLDRVMPIGKREGTLLNHYSEIINARNKDEWIEDEEISVPFLTERQARNMNNLVHKYALVLKLLDEFRTRILSKYSKGESHIRNLIKLENNKIVSIFNGSFLETLPEKTSFMILRNEKLYEAEDNNKVLLVINMVNNYVASTHFIFEREKSQTKRGKAIDMQKQAKMVLNKEFGNNKRLFLHRNIKSKVDYPGIDTLTAKTSKIYVDLIKDLAKSGSFKKKTIEKAKNIKNQKEKDIIKNEIKEIKEVKKELKEIVKEETKKRPDVKRRGISLYKYQVEHLKKLLKILSTHQTALDASETGTGKTFVSLFVVKELGVPFFVVCPNIVVPGWERSIEDIEKTNPGFKNKCLGVVNYETLKTGKYYIFKEAKSGKNKGKLIRKRVKCPYIEVKEATGSKKKYEAHKEYIWNLPANTIIIFDEAHRMRNKRTLESQLLISLVEQSKKYKILLLSATIAESPLKMYPTGLALQLFSDSYEFYNSFIRRYGAYQKKIYTPSGRPVKIWTVDNLPTQMKKLYRVLSDPNNLRMARMSGENLPPTKIIPMLIELPPSSKKELEVLLSKKVSEAVVGGKIEAEKLEERGLKMPAIIKARKAEEAFEIPFIIEKVKDILNENRSAVIFVSFKQTVKLLKEELEKTFKKKKMKEKVVTLYGDDSKKDIALNQELFLRNEAHVIIGTYSLAREGIDLHDKYQTRPRTSILIPNYNGIYVKQALGRVARAGGTKSIQYIFFIRGTIEEDVYKKMKEKIDAFESINSGKNAKVSTEELLNDIKSIIDEKLEDFRESESIKRSAR